MNPLLETRDLEVRIGGRCLCTGLQLAVHAGQAWALLGPNGVGKSTLLLHVAGLARPRHGQVLLGGDVATQLAPRRRARRVGLLLQHSGAGFGGPVLEQVLCGRHPHLSTLAWEGPDDLAIAQRALALLGLNGLGARAVETLSGGELRRVEIARLLVQQAPLTLLDEPFNHLDLAHQAGCLGVLADECVGPTRALLMVVHDLNLAYQACPHWLLLDGDGGWHAGSREEIADPALLTRVFGHPIRRLDTDEGPLLLPAHAPARR